MTNFERALAILGPIEGGYVNDPADPGGETIYGISRRAHPEAWRLGPPSKEEAAAIYKSEYWDAVGGDLLPWPINLLTFDFAVNSGSHRAVAELQQNLNVPADGIVGPKTVVAALKMVGNKEFVALLLADRALFMESLAGWARYKRGWLKRLFLNAMEA